MDMCCFLLGELFCHRNDGWCMALVLLVEYAEYVMFVLLFVAVAEVTPVWHSGRASVL